MIAYIITEHGSGVLPRGRIGSFRVAGYGPSRSAARIDAGPEWRQAVEVPATVAACAALDVGEAVEVIDGELRAAGEADLAVSHPVACLALDRVRILGDEAAAAVDRAQVLLCARALQGDGDALAACAQAVRDACPPTSRTGG
ncbi:MAG: hypothetical protein JW751_25455 [Polyangiaceae bacterium]|nr:hypothetical protein [Polyangiaceae bacterium]